MCWRRCRVSICRLCTFRSLGSSSEGEGLAAPRCQNANQKPSSFQPHLHGFYFWAQQPCSSTSRKFLKFYLIHLWRKHKLFRCVKWYILEKHWYAVPIFQGVITLFVLINFSMATFMDPGVSKNILVHSHIPEDFFFKTIFWCFIHF